MKKVMIGVLSFLMLACVSLLVEGSGFDFTSISTQSQNDKTKIKKEDLPQAAKSTLNGDAFKGWAVENAYKLNNGEFEVELKKGSTSQTLKFDKDGKVK
jgi:uncharacterized protein YxeA